MAIKSEKMELLAKARSLKIEGYRAMSSADLRKAITAAEGTSKRSNGAGSKRKSAAVVSAATTGGKKRSGRKSAPAVESAKTGEAKRRSATGTKRKVGRPKGTTTSARATSNGKPGRNPIDTRSLDWTKEWKGGKTGVRAEVFRLLKKFKGNREKVFDSLEDEATKFFTTSQKTGKKYSKAEAIAMLKWLIHRVAFDFAMDTGQHRVSTNRQAWGTSTGRKPQGSKRTPAAERPRSGRKTAGGRKTAATVAAAQKPAQKRAGASAGGTVKCQEPGCKKRAPRRGRYAGWCEEHRPAQKMRGSSGRKVKK